MCCFIYLVQFTGNLEVIKEHDCPLPERVLLIRVPDALEELDLVQGGLCVVAGGFDHLEGDELLIF